MDSDGAARCRWYAAGSSAAHGRASVRTRPLPAAHPDPGSASGGPDRVHRSGLAPGSRRPSAPTGLASPRRRRLHRYGLSASRMPVRTARCGTDHTEDEREGPHGRPADFFAYLQWVPPCLEGGWIHSIQNQPRPRFHVPADGPNVLQRGQSAGERVRFPHGEIRRIYLNDMHQPEVHLSHRVAIVVEDPHRPRLPRAANHQLFLQFPLQPGSNHIVCAFHVATVDVPADADTVFAVEAGLAAFRAALDKKQTAPMPYDKVRNDLLE